MMRNIPSLATVLASLALATGCPSDDSSQNDNGNTEGNDSSTGEESNTNPSTLDTTVSSTMTDPATTEPPETTMDPDSSSSEGSCEGVCQEDEDCLPGQSCISCLCIGEPVGCAEYGPGAFDNCVGPEGPDSTLCTEGGFCLNGGAEIAACAYACTEPCDCPAPPKGFEGQLACDDLTGDKMNDCFIDCSGGGDCPTGMICFMGTACLFGEEPMGLPPYGDCVNVEGQCEGGTCLVDVVEAPTLGWCGPTCTDDDSCPDPTSGTAAPVCVDVSGEGDLFCELDCGGDATCPDGMECLAGPDICIWNVVEPVVPGYGDCANAAAEEACLATETCFDDATGSVCTGECTLPADCAPAPATGDAPVACDDIGGGSDTCYLDCSGGQTCPDTMECVDDNYCHFLALTFLIDEDFEGGELPDGWSVLDVDGNTPAMEVDFVDAAWVISGLVEGDENFAAYSTSWYTPAGQSDDWLISPQVTLGATSQVRWEGWATDAGFPDGYEVRISTTGTDPADFMIEPVLFSVDDRLQEFTFHSVDVSDYADQMVYIAFRNNSDDENLLLIDNVQITE